MAFTLTWPTLEVVPPVELVKLRSPDFFPGIPSLAAMRSVCIGTKSRNLGDALALSSLPAKLKRKYPHLRVSTYPRGFNPVVFRHNPFVDGVAYLPDALYGDDANLGEGQLIQLKERFLGLPRSEDPAPEIHLTEGERERMGRFIRARTLPGNEDKPLVALHAWGSTNRRVAEVEFWDEVVARWSGRARFWQLGVLGDGAIQGCEYYFLTERRRSEARRMFALLAHARGFLGVDSGPMHAARAFRLPSLVLLGGKLDPERIFADRAAAPYFLRGNWKSAQLYAANRHVGLGVRTPAQVAREVDDFLERIAGPPATEVQR